MPLDPHNSDMSYWVSRLREQRPGDPDWLSSIESLKRAAENRVPELIDYLAIRDYPVYLGVTAALRKMGPGIMYHLIAAMKHEDAGVRADAGQLLSEYAFQQAPLVIDALAVLTAALNDPDDTVREKATIALAALGPEAEGAVPGLINALRDPDYYVREWAAHALGRIGPAAREALPVLTEVLLDDVPGVREAASDAINEIQ